jgi:hypothetical protein
LELQRWKWTQSDDFASATNRICLHTLFNLDLTLFWKRRGRG